MIMIHRYPLKIIRVSLDLLHNLLVTIAHYIQTYCHAYLIPYEVELYNDENPSIDLERLSYPVKTFIS